MQNIQSDHSFPKYRLQVILGMVGLFFCLNTKAQTYFAPSFYNSNFIQWTPLPENIPGISSGASNQKWFVSKYMALQAGSAFYPWGNAFVLSAPIGVQVSRKINNNLYGFGGVYVAPTYTNFSQTFMNPSINKSYSGLYGNPYSIGINPGVQMGLMYINDAGTFSISGSIRAERSSYPVYYHSTNNSKSGRQ
ncbi:MAG: hypothetical protein C5B59_19900 [Bacteroidetes bacterium]|nr:MAG: hypothetical protein C5B59_19900 [Bacteroidota bacterium]